MNQQPYQKYFRLLKYLKESQPNPVDQINPFTAEEIDSMEFEFDPVSGNLADGGWIMPGGEILDFRRSRRGSAVRHSQIFDCFDPERRKELMSFTGLSRKQLVYENDSPVIDICLKNGLIRYNVSEFYGDVTIYMSVETEPSNQQIGSLWDLAEYIGKNVQPTRRFDCRIQANGICFSYDSPDEAGKRMVNDIRSSFRR